MKRAKFEQFVSQQRDGEDCLKAIFNNDLERNARNELQRQFALSQTNASTAPMQIRGGLFAE